MATRCCRNDRTHGRLKRVPTLVPSIVAFVLATVAIGCSNPDPPAVVEDVPFREDGRLAFTRDGQEISDIAIEIADDDSARTRGLMQRSSLDSGTGMLFIFPTSDLQSFWMANTQISLDILFVAADSTIVDIQKYTRPLSPENVGGTHQSRFVVEVPAGYTDNHGIVEGDRIRWNLESE